MAFPVGTFFSAYAGKLKVELRATFYVNNRVDAGFRSNPPGGANISIRAYAGPAGAPSYSVIFDRFSSVASLELNYPGNVSWPVGVQETGHINPTSGIWFYGMQNIELACKLIKR